MRIDRGLILLGCSLLLAGPVGCGTVAQGVSPLPDRYPLGDSARAARNCYPQDLPRELSKTTLEEYRVEPGDGLLVLPADLDSKVRMPADQTILDCLIAHGCDPMFDCKRGECGVCATPVIEGEIEHRDYVLSEREKREGTVMQICISRCKGQRLVLDL